MKSKKYILMQIRDLMIKKFDSSEEDADAYVDQVQTKTVYELLVLKKELTQKEVELPDVSTRQWFRGYFSWEQ